MVATNSVVTPERFAQGLSYREYVSQIGERYRGLYERDYRRFRPTAEEIAEFRALMERPKGPAKVMIITEEWCPDCYREVPVITKLAEATGMELRIVARDANKDIMAEFLRDGQFESIPVFVFYTRDHEYIAHFIERSKAADQGMVEVRKLFEGRTREEARADYEAFQSGPTWDSWQHATVRELIDVLDERTR